MCTRVMDHWVNARFYRGIDYARSADNALSDRGLVVSAPVKLSEDDLSTVELVLRLLDLSTRSKQFADRELIDVLFQPVDRCYP
jgi:hypothetical protein